MSFEQRKSKLENLSLESVFEQDSNDRALLLSLITSQKICESLYGELKESQTNNRVQYEATFIAELENELSHPPDHDIVMPPTA